MNIKKASFESTTYRISRQSTPSTLTNLHQAVARARAKKKNMSEPLTYEMVLNAADEAVDRGELPAGATRGRKSTLTRALATLGIQTSSVVGVELRRDFDATLEAWSHHLSDQGYAPERISNTRSHLRWWRNFVVDIDKRDALRAGSDTPFQQALKSLLVGHPIKRVARHVGVSHDMVFGWRNGKLPRQSSYVALRRLETFFGLQRDALIMLLGGRANLGRDAVVLGETPKIGYRAKLADQIQDEYGLLMPSEHLRNEWQALMRHKTAPVTPLARKEPWRTSKHLPHRTLHWYATLNGEDYIATAEAHWNHYRYYFGYLLQDMATSGLPEGSEPSLAWLTLPEGIQAYIEFRVRRSGKASQIITQFLGNVSSLLRRETGYLRQMPALAAALPSSLRPNNWDEHCEVAFNICEKLKRFYADRVSPSRDPFEPLAAILDLPQPLDAVADMLDRMRAAAPPAGTKRVAEWMRDIALIQVLTSNPLRAKNLRELTWKADNTGELYQKQDGSWHIRIGKLNFKNFKGAARDRIYDMPVQPSVWSSLSAYIRKYRPMILGTHVSDRVFLTRECARRGIAWAELSARVQVQTQRFLWRCPGIGAHAFRYIVGTSILKAAPGNYGLAAMVLHDRVKTVEKHYARVNAGDSAEQLGALLEKSYKRL